MLQILKESVLSLWKTEEEFIFDFYVIKSSWKITVIINKEKR